MSLFTFFFSPRISSQANVIGKPGLLVSPYNNNNNNSPVKWGCVQGNLQQIAGLGSEASSGAQTLFFNRDSDLLLDLFTPCLSFAICYQPNQSVVHTPDQSTEVLEMKTH